jgi:hypothetical protein
MPGSAVRRLAAGLCGLLALGLPARATPLSWDLKIDLPPIIQDSTKPRQCTVTWLLDDTATNDVYAVRMQITPTEDARPVGDRMPCPPVISPRIAARALDVCTARAADPRSCVYADMSRGFERERDIRNTAENSSRCASDQFSHIGVACWKSGGLEVCDVGCGRTAEDARAAARARCGEKHQKSCDTVGSLPVLAPD